MAKANLIRFVHPVSFLIFLCFHLQCNIAATDSILQGQKISFPDTIISAGGVFELGFFIPGNSTNYYLGIWYKKVAEQTVVWIANRDYPVSRASGSGVLMINADGNLVIQNQKIFYMVTNATSNGNTSAILMDSGNLVLKDSNSVILWQSFDYPSHAYLPGMKLGINKRNGSAWSLVSWKSSGDPGFGKFSLQVDANGSSQFLIMKGSQIYWTSGIWNGQIFSLVPEMRSNYIYNYSYISNEYERYFIYSLYNTSASSYLSLDVSGQIQQRTWLKSTQQWNLFWSQPRRFCDVYATCGSFGVCTEYTSTGCGCLDGFEPRSSEDWSQGDRSGGCLRKVPLQCENTTAVNGDKDKFLGMPNMKYPVDAQDFAVSSAKECKLVCLRSCSCSAYAYNGSRGCSIWNGGLLNMQELSDDDTLRKTIYVKLAASELPGSKGHKRLLFEIVPVVASLAVLLLGCYFCHQWRNKIKQKGKMKRGQNILLFDMSVSTTTTNSESSNKKAGGISKSDDSGLPLFTFASVSAATDNFSAVNKLGEGGFGPVYKGKLLKGSEIAVKRLSKRSGQGLDELKNEALLIAKLQHRNLVKLLGCCLEQEEKILIYEYMPNKSLDTFLFGLWPFAIPEGYLYNTMSELLRGLPHFFMLRTSLMAVGFHPQVTEVSDPTNMIEVFNLENIFNVQVVTDSTKRGLLDWGTRVRIIEGIAQGLLYLHQYSRWRIIHRDLKASNILLDVEMNSKISDFGMARICGGNELEANTNRIVGTYGYMSPEYAAEGLFSVKSDVFSFGVLLLEIVSGKKNTGFYQTDSLNLLGHAWDLWKGDRALDLMDPILEEIFSKQTVLRYINVALLCVQEIAADRPTMSEVVSMFNNESVLLPSPKQPAFSTSRSVATPKSTVAGPENCSTNDVTVSLLEPR